MCNVFKTLLLIFVVTTVATPAFAKTAKKQEMPLETLKLVEGDESGNEVKSVKTELLVSKSEKTAIQQVQKLIKRHKKTRLEPDLWFRLAELYMRRSKTERFFEINRQSETVVSLVPVIVKKASSRAAITDAIKTYEHIQRAFPSYHRMDLVMFNNAFARQHIGQSKEAEAIYWGLIKKYPSSELIPDSHLAIGELNFERKTFKHALDHFIAIEKYPHSRVYPYGLYKAGWTYYNLREPLAGIKKLEEVVAYGRKIAAEGIDSRLDLRREALTDMTIFYEDVYASKDAFKYFEKQASELEVEPIIMKLSKIYERHSRWNDRDIILRDILAHRPKSEVIPEVYNELVWNYEHMKNKPAAVREMQAFSKLCKSNSDWMESRPPAPKVQAKGAEKYVPPYDHCIEMLRETSLRLAGKWLKTWKKNSSFPEFAEAAEKSFEIYLDDPGKGEEPNEARFAYAELLFQREKFRQASSEYARVSKAPAKGTISHDAGYAALLSLEKAVGEKWSDADEKNFHELAKSYVGSNPQGKFVLDVEFKIGMIAYEKSRYEEAAPIFLKLGDLFAKEEKGLKSQDLYLDILNIKKDYKGLKEYSASLMKKGVTPERSVALNKIYQEAYFLQIQHLEENKAYAEALKEYRKFADENPKSALAEKALWNSFQLHFKILDYAGGADTGVVFYERYPNSKQAMDALLKTAQTYESMGQLSQAALVLEDLVKVDTKQSLKWKMLAADFYALSFQAGKARRLYSELRTQGKADDQKQAFEKLVLLEKQQPNSQEYKVLLDQIVRNGVQPQASLAHLQVVEGLFEGKNYERTFIEAKKILNMGGKASEYAKSRARFLQARILEEEFLAQSVKARPDRIGLVLALKTEKLEKAQDAYQSAIRYGDPKVAVQSLQRLSSLYTHYVQSLRSMPVPDGLTKQDEEMFKGEMDRLAIPLEEKGVETMAQALQNAKKFNLRDGTIADIQRSLSSLNMQAPQEIQLPVEAPQVSLPVPQGVGS